MFVTGACHRERGISTAGSGRFDGEECRTALVGTLETFDPGLKKMEFLVVAGKEWSISVSPIGTLNAYDHRLE